MQSITDVPLSIDSSIVEALEAGLSVYQGKALVNSVTGEDEQMERVLPLVAKYGAAVVAISNDETGISEDPDVRFEVARKIVNRAADYGIPKERHRRRPARDADRRDGHRRPPGVPAPAAPGEELGVNTTCGASNVSFGLPNRTRITGTFLPMAIANGMTSAIMSPLHAEVKLAIWAADVLAGNDEDCAAWIRDANREPATPPRRPRGPRAVAAARAPRGSPGRPSADGTVTDHDHLVVFTPSGRAARSRPARPCSRRPGGSASTSTRCAADAASAAAARSR